MTYRLFRCLGSRGLKREVWTETAKPDLSDVADLKASAADYKSGVTVDASSPNVVNKTSAYSSRFSSFFVAPWDDHYSFHINCDDKCQLNVKESSDPSAKVTNAWVKRRISLLNFSVIFA